MPLAKPPLTLREQQEPDVEATLHGLCADFGAQIMAPWQNAQ